MSNKPKIYGTCPAGCLWETVHKSDFLKSATFVEVAVVNGSCTVDGFGKYRIHSAQGETGGYYAAKIYLMDGAWATPMAPLATFTVEFDELRSYFDFELLAATVDDDPTTSVTDLKVVYEVNGDRKTVYYSGSCAEPLLLITGADRVYRYNDGTIEAVDGVSPTVEVTEIAGGHRVSITDANGTQTFYVMDGDGAGGGTGGGTVTVTVDGAAGTASHSSTEIYALVQAGNTVVAVLPDYANHTYQYDKYNEPTAANAMRATVEFIHTAVDENGIVTTDYIIIHDDKSADAGYYEGTGGADGITPHIGENGNWYIGTEDTGVKAAGEDGVGITSVDEMGGDATRTTHRMNFSDGSYYEFDVYHGEKGDKGDPYTLTEDDKALIVAQVIASLGGNPIFGYVEDDGTIVVQGNLADGEYTVKYEYEVEENGETVTKTIDIGDLVLDNNVYYSVTKNLTACTVSNSATKVVAGGSYSATITPDSGYELSSVTVTMGGSAVSVSGGNISIASVTGDIVITAVATEAAVTPSYHNLLPDAVDADGNAYVGTNGEDGYKAGYRLKGATGLEAAASGAYCTGFMPVSFGDKVYVKDITMHATETHNAFALYNSSKELIKCTSFAETGYNCAELVGDVWCLENDQVTASTAVAFFRLSCGGITGDTIITVNEPLS